MCTIKITAENKTRALSSTLSELFYYLKVLLKVIERIMSDITDDILKLGLT
jgi:hypothetical protein